MRTNLKTATFSAMMVFAALSAAADIARPPITNDPLTQQIMRHMLIRKGPGEVTGAVRIASGETIPLKFAEPPALIKPSEGLVAKPVKTKDSKNTRYAAAQLKIISEEKQRSRAFR
ncbi:MAG: hypothetical protein AAB268_12810 [Elusimicrobiota bacterium]